MDEARPMGRRRLVLAFVRSWLLPIVVLLVLFSVVALLTEGNGSILQRIYSVF